MFNVIWALWLIVAIEGPELRLIKVWAHIMGTAIYETPRTHYRQSYSLKTNK